MARLRAFAAALLLAAAAPSVFGAPVTSAAPATTLTSGPIGARAIFNDPVQDPGAIERAEAALINGAVSPDSQPTVMVSAYHFTDRRLATDLVNLALQHEAHVEVVLDGSDRTLGCSEAGCVNQAYNMLGFLNLSGDPQSWLKTCDGIGPKQPWPLADAGNGCVGKARDHNKFMLFSRTNFLGTTYTDVVLQTSSNLTPPSYNAALNYALVVYGEPTLYADYAAYFHRLAAAYRRSTPPSVARFDHTYGTSVDTASLPTHDITTWSFPQARSSDPVPAIFNGLDAANGCRARVDIAISFVRQRRNVIAAVARIAAAGCRVSMVYTRMDAVDLRRLGAAGVKLARLCIDKPDSQRGLVEYLHSKYILVAGDDRRTGSNVRETYTGSENWTTSGLTNTDDRLLRFVEPARRAPLFAQFANNFSTLRDLAMTGHRAPRGCTETDD